MIGAYICSLNSGRVLINDVYYLLYLIELINQKHTNNRLHKNPIKNWRDTRFKLKPTKRVYISYFCSEIGIGISV